MEKTNQKVYCCRQRLILVALLNISDWFCTMVILKNKGFFEVNPFMANLIENPMLCFFVKIILPFALMMYIFYMVPKIRGKLLNAIAVIMLVLTGFYLAINIVHIFNFVLLLILQ